MPWSIEDTIENLKEIKELLQRIAIEKNLHGKGKEDAEEVAFDFDRAIEALEMKRKYEKQWLDDINNPLEPMKLSSALQSEIFKLEYRKANKPKEISILDYTVIYALKDCLERYSGKGGVIYDKWRQNQKHD